MKIIIRFFCLTFVLISALTVPSGAVEAEDKSSTIFKDVEISVPKDCDVEIFSKNIVKAISDIKDTKQNFIMNDMLNFILWNYMTDAMIELKKEGLAPMNEDNAEYIGWYSLCRMATLVKEKSKFSLYSIIDIGHFYKNKQFYKFEFFSKNVSVKGYPMRAYIRPDKREINKRLEEHQKQLENILN